MKADRTPSKDKDAASLLKTTITHSGSMDAWPAGHISIVDVRPNALPATIAGRLMSISDVVNFVSKTTHRPGRLRSESWSP